MMKNMSTIEELNAKMILIAESANMSLEQFKKLSVKKLIKICNEYNSKLK